MTQEIRYFILVKDIVKQTEYIYNDIPIDYNSISNTFLICCNELKNELKENYKNIIINKNETYCEIINEVLNKQKGYLWNVNQVENNVLFLLTLIKTRSNYLEKTITQLVTTLMDVRIDTINKSIKFIHDKIDLLDNKLDNKIDLLDNKLNTIKENTCGNLLNTEGNFNSEGNLNIPKIFINDNVITGYKYEHGTYMKDLFKKETSLIDFSDNYLTELKEKLSLPNFGLTDNIRLKND